MQLLASAADEQDWIREALAETLSRPRWRVWRYRTPAIVLGLSQRRLHEAASARAGASLPVLVRGSGGGAVLAGPWMISVTVLLPTRHPRAAGSLVDSYRWFSELHARVLRELGVETRVFLPEAPGDAQAPVGGVAPLPWACFGALSPWELTDDDGRKLCGLAQQRRSAGIAFVSGTLLWRSPWALLCEALDRADEARALEARTTDCESLARADGAPPGNETRRETFASALASRLDAALGQALGI